MDRKIQTKKFEEIVLDPINRTIFKNIVKNNIFQIYFFLDFLSSRVYTLEHLKWDKKYSCNSTSSISYSCHIFGDISKYFTLGSVSNIL